MPKGTKKSCDVKETMRAQPRADTTQNVFWRLLYFGWPNQPSSGIMKIFRLEGFIYKKKRK